MPLERRKFSQRMCTVFIVFALVLSTVAVQVHRVVGEFVDTSHWVAHSMAVRQEIIQTVAILHGAEASLRAHLINESPERLADFIVAVPQISEHSSTLQALVADSPEQSQMARELHAMLELRLTALHELLGKFRSDGISAARQSTQMIQSHAEDLKIDELGQRMLRHEDVLLSQRQGQIAAQALLTRVLTIGAILSSVLLLAAALWLILREQRQRVASMDEARAANLELMRSLNESQRLSQTLRQLSELSEMLQSCRTMNEAVTGLSLALPGLLPASSGTVHLINNSANAIETVAHWGCGIPGETGIFGPDDCWALRRGHAYPPADSRTAVVCRHLQPWRLENEDQSRLCVPIIAQGEILGVITAVADRPFITADRNDLIAACETASMAMANLRLQETLRTQSLRDPLTGLFNRRYLEASLEREVQRAQRQQHPLSVLMLDLDNFKRFNDHFGHEAGDALLASFGSLLQSLVRSEDVACRYGGEEFTILMHETDSAQALARAEQICAATRAMDVQHRRQQLGTISVSIGIATLPIHGDTPEDLLRKADLALYAAKRGGRDQARIADTNPVIDIRDITESGLA